MWDVRFPRIGDHPAVVLSVNPLNNRLSHVTVAVVTGTPGPEPTHVPLGGEAGLTRYDVSFVNATDLHGVAKGWLRHRRGVLHHRELARVESAVRLYLGLT